MVLGIILIIIGVVGAIATVVYGIKFMKANNIIFRGDYVELKTNVENYKNKISSNIDIEYQGEDTQILVDENMDTILLDQEQGQDTEILL